MERVVLLDFDSICYKAMEDLDTYKDRVDEIISQIVEETSATHYKVFLEAPGSKSFRKLLNHKYKANRKGKPLPINFKDIKDYIIESYNPYLSYLEETDDSIISTLKYLNNEYPLTEVIIAANDKDYKTKELVYYDLYYGRFGEIVDISKKEANYNFWIQMLVGDSTDNVSGVRGIGKKGAERILKSSKNYFISTYRAYYSKYGVEAREEFKENYLMLNLRDDTRPCTEFDKVEF